MSLKFVLQKKKHLLRPVEFRETADEQNHDPREPEELNASWEVHLQSQLIAA